MLVEAGLLDQPAATRRPSLCRAEVQGSRQGRVDDVIKHIVGRTGQFTLADIAAAVPGSPMTIRKAVTTLLESGAIVKLGPAPHWPAPGRAPIIYRRHGTAG